MGPEEARRLTCSAAALQPVFLCCRAIKRVIPVHCLEHASSSSIATARGDRHIAPLPPPLRSGGAAAAAATRAACWYGKHAVCLVQALITLRATYITLRSMPRAPPSEVLDPAGCPTQDRRCTAQWRTPRQHSTGIAIVPAGRRKKHAARLQWPLLPQLPHLLLLIASGTHSEP